MVQKSYTRPQRSHEARLSSSAAPAWFGEGKEK
jgi:hypothetical protein